MHVCMYVYMHACMLSCEDFILSSVDMHYSAVNVCASICTISIIRTLVNVIYTNVHVSIAMTSLSDVTHRPSLLTALLDSCVLHILEHRCIVCYRLFSS